jgi:hypothetical protein
MISGMDLPAHRVDDSDARARDAAINERARREILRRDGERTLGENLERAAALIKDSFELRDAFADSPR